MRLFAAVTCGAAAFTIKVCAAEPTRVSELRPEGITASAWILIAAAVWITADTIDGFRFTADRNRFTCDRLAAAIGDAAASAASTSTSAAVVIG